jgi:hypothetical protein
MTMRKKINYAAKIRVINAKISVLEAQKAELQHKQKEQAEQPTPKRPKPKKPSTKPVKK